MRNYQKREAWKISMDLTKEVYLLTLQFPKEELYGLTSQARLASSSIPSNIAEGMGRQYKKDTIHFLHIARGSIYELETLLNISIMVNLIVDIKFHQLINLLDDTIRLLSGFINYIKNSSLK